MASRTYCTNVAMELKFLSEKLHKLSSEIDHIPSIDKFKLTPQLQSLNIIMTELDDRLSNLMSSCDTVESPYARDFDGSGLVMDANLKKAKNEYFDYDFGG